MNNMDGCYNCRFRGQDLTSKECVTYFSNGNIRCRNWKKEYWWQKIIREVKRRI